MHWQSYNIPTPPIVHIMRTYTLRCDKHKKKAPYNPTRVVFLRLAEELDDEADGLGREELGILALVAAGEGSHQRRTTLDPLREVVGGHVGVTVGEIQLSQFALGVTLDRHNSFVLSATMKDMKDRNQTFI